MTTQTENKYPNLNNVLWEYVVETTDDGEVTEPPAKCIKTNDCKVICDIPLLAQALEACQFCKNPLKLIHCERMQCFGLGCQLLVKCYNADCLKTNVIDTGNRHRIHNYGSMTWNINTKTAAGK